MKKTRILLCLATIIGLTGCNNKPSEEVKVKSVEIIKNQVQIEDLEVIIGDQIDLNILVNDNLTPSLTWESSNPSIVSVDKDGKLNVLDKGDVIVTVKVTDAPYITDSIHVSSSKKVEQTGVGSGKTKNDPIFIGNEGEDEPIEVYFLEMTQIYSDSIFIKKGNVEVLIDAGYQYDGQYVNKVLTQYCTDNRLDLLMASHSDGDHIDGYANALETMGDVSLMIDYGGNGSGNVLNARNKYTAKGMKYYSAYDCVNGIGDAQTRYYLTKDFYVDVLNTGNYIASNEKSAGNANSLAVIFHYKDFSFFTGGDLTTESEKDLLKNEVLPEVTLFKAHHHGSNGSNSAELLNTINPKAVAISAARASRYGITYTGPKESDTYNLDAASGHPYENAIKNIYSAPNISQNLNVYWNAVNGTMKFTSYGEDDFEFTGSKTMKGYYDLSKTNGVGVWNSTLNDFENRVTGEENFKFHETVAFKARNYQQYLPQWARDQYFSNN
ncbi:MAG: hypothetical protein E7177_02145 [Erysipelotrichaceae bacterium]|nr:hypothetical protein [Erysipelotrichaceae bacterium]